MVKHCSTTQHITKQYYSKEMEHIRILLNHVASVIKRFSSKMCCFNKIAQSAKKFHQASF